MIRKRIAGMLLAVGLAAASGCGSDDTTEFCGAACDIWASCAAWDRAICMSQCQADGDWDQAYVTCLEGQSCATLDACG